MVLNAINEIAQFTTDIRYKSGTRIPVADWLSRSLDVKNNNKNQSPDWSSEQLINAIHSPPPHKSGLDFDPVYVPPDKTMAALEEVALHTICPRALAEAQAQCPVVKAHRAGNLPRNVVMADVEVAGHTLFSEVSDPANPRPLVPDSHKNIILNLIHHNDHPSVKETIRRTASQYYWPSLRTEVTEFVRSCHPCQVAKQSTTVKPGIGEYPIVDKRFSYIHLDVVGPLPESEGYSYLLSVYD